MRPWAYVLPWLHALNAMIVDWACVQVVGAYQADRAVGPLAALGTAAVKAVAAAVPPVAATVTAVAANVSAEIAPAAAAVAANVSAAVAPAAAAVVTPRPTAVAPAAPLLTPATAAVAPASAALGPVVQAAAGPEPCESSCSESPCHDATIRTHGGHLHMYSIFQCQAVHEQHGGVTTLPHCSAPLHHLRDAEDCMHAVATVIPATIASAQAAAAPAVAQLPPAVQQAGVATPVPTALPQEVTNQVQQQIAALKQQQQQQSPPAPVAVSGAPVAVSGAVLAPPPVISSHSPAVPPLAGRASIYVIQSQ